MKVQKKTDGFTIIEVLIVLAIAGLILLIVFLAVPALQRNSRNTQRKNDVQALLGGVSEYTNNNNGKPPASNDDLTKAIANAKLSYYDSNVTYDDGSDGTDNPNDDTVIVSVGAKCITAEGDTKGNAEPGSSRQIAVLYTVENSSGNTKACQDS